MSRINRFQHKPIWFFLISLVLLLSAQTKCIADATLVVTPTRIAFDQRTRTAQVTLSNTGDKIGTYRISFVRRHMLEDGNLIEAKKGEKGNFSDELIRYSPRQVQLPPGQSQVVRLMLRKPRNLPEGEYRSHMLFQGLPDARNDLDPEANKNSDGISVQITTVVGITIPVIVRHGKLDAELSLEDPQFIPADNNKKIPPRLAISMIRSGNRSVHGDFKITYTSEGKATGLVVGQVKGLAVYTPNTKRRYTIRLTPPSGVNFDEGSFDIVYSEQTKKSNVGIISKASLKIP